MRIADENHREYDKQVIASGDFNARMKNMGHSLNDNGVHLGGDGFEDAEEYDEDEESEYEEFNPDFDSNDY